MKMRLLVLPGICLGIIALCAAFLLQANPAYAATAQTSVKLIPMHSGGGCTPGKVALAACIGQNSGVSDAYVNSGPCVTRVVIDVVDYTNGTIYNVANAGGNNNLCLTGHIPGAKGPLVSGHEFYTSATFFFQNGKSSTVASPHLKW